ncbi:MAG TPA: hydroxyacid dehydrogenase [Bauldia sp.]|nr:hydroxyacid dehydrogenase [Bauldia sp.]
MPHVLVAGKIHRAGVSILQAAPGVTLDLVDEVSTASYAPMIGKADALLIRSQPMPGSVIAAAPKLKIVSRHGVGYDSVDVNALSARGIPLAIVGDVNSAAVAEHTLMLILGLAKRMLPYDSSVRRGQWGVRDTFAAIEIEGRTLLILGFGRIGRRVARLAMAFGMKVVAYDPYLEQATIRDAGVTAAPELGAALEVADFVTIHAPMSHPHAVVGAAEFARMKPSAFVVNTARGGLVDERALADALTTGRIAGAGLDVFEVEPALAPSALLESDRVVVTPHSAALTEECAERMAVAAAHNIVDFFNGKLDPELIVNRAALQK